MIVLGKIFPLIVVLIILEGLVLILFEPMVKEFRQMSYMYICPFRYNFNKVAQYKQLTLEEAEEKMKNRKKTADGYERWMMKAASNGPAAFGEHGRFEDKESGGVGGGGRGRKKSSDDDEGHVSDKGEEDEEEEAARKNRLGLNKRGGDDDEEGPRGGDHDLDDDDSEKGEHNLVCSLYLLMSVVIIFITVF